MEFIQIYHKDIANLDASQFAYKKNSSTICAVIQIHNNIIKHLEDRSVKAASIIALDLSKAFDSIDHSLLITFMQELKVPDWLVAWVSAFVGDRIISLRMLNRYSKEFNMDRGIPQGGVLSPFLFSLYFSRIQCDENLIK